MTPGDAHASGDEAGIGQYQLWVERPFTAIADPDSNLLRWGPYLGLALLLTAVVSIPPLLEYLDTGVFPVLEAPAMLMIPPTYLAIVWVSRHLRDQYYEDTIPRLQAIRDDDREPVKAFIRNRYPDAVDAITTGDTPSIPGASPEVERQIAALWTSDATDTTSHRSWLTRLGLVPPPTAADRFGDIVPQWVRGVVLLGGWGIHALWFVIDPNPMRNIVLTYGGEVAAVYFYGVVPLVLIPIAADLVTIFIGVTILLPLKVVAADRVDFGDPAQFAGLRPVGTLIRNAGFAIPLFLIAWFVLETIAPEGDPFDLFSIIVMGGGATLAIVLFFVPVLYLHRFMHQKKHEKIQDITSLLAASGPREEGQVFPRTMIGHYDAYDQDTYHEYTHLHIHLTRVENTNEYPVDAGIIAEFLFILAIPFFAHLAWTYVFKALLH